MQLYIYIYVYSKGVASFRSSKGGDGTPPPQESSGHTFMFFIQEMLYHNITCKKYIIYV